MIDSDSGEVLEWDEEDGVGDVLATSFSSFLESYRNDLLSGHMDYIDGCGVIEKMSGSKK